MYYFLIKSKAYSKFESNININLMSRSKNWIHKAYRFYAEGFSNMTWGKSVWMIILIKLFLIFFVMKFFFFSNNPGDQLKSQEEKGAYYLENLTNKK